ncbi:MAG: ABC transporter substrate-binding protein [Chloroflexota bacterium]
MVKSRLSRAVMLCLVSIIILGLFAACAAPVEEEKVLSQIEITDQLGRTVRLAGVPQSIVSLAPSNTEILFALGLGERVLAVTDYCNYPPEAEEKPSVGGFSTPNIEKVVAYSPDLILAGSIHEDRVIPQLEQKGFTVLALESSILEEVMESIAFVGAVAGKEKEAAELLTAMRLRIKSVTDKTDGLSIEQRPRVFYAVWHDPLKTAGGDTIHSELIQKAGGTNIAGDLAGYAGIGLETVLDANPQVIIASTTHGSSGELTFRFMETEPRLSTTDARRYHRVYHLDGNLVSRTGPRLVDGLEIFARFIHPELFP